jgi:hypothetical protein
LGWKSSGSEFVLLKARVFKSSKTMGSVFQAFFNSSYFVDSTCEYFVIFFTWAKTAIYYYFLIVQDSVLLDAIHQYHIW